MEVVYKWESVVSFSWKDSCTRDRWSFFRKMAKKSPSQVTSVEFCDFERVNFRFFLSTTKKSAFTALKMVRTITAFDTSSLIIGQRISPQTCI